jgi:SAM-dependent methyltransferase
VVAEMVHCRALPCAIGRMAMRILNLGCGTKTSSSPEVINIDWSMYLKLKKNRILRMMAPLYLSGERLQKFNSLSANVMCHDLSKGIPFESDSVDVVYHSHLLEHFDRDVAREFLLEIRRVLKPGGVHRIAVPDFEMLCKEYLCHIRICEEDPNEASCHDDYIAAIIEQSVRRDAYGTSQQSPLERFLENLLLGDARKRGEVHQWMYDRISLSELLISLGYRNPRIHKYNTSSIPNWSEYKLELNEFGDEYKPDSSYIEAIK